MTRSDPSIRQSIFHLHADKVVSESLDKEVPLHNTDITQVDDSLYRA